MNKQAHQDSMIADQAESGDATSAQSTGKMDPQVSGWTKRVRVGKHLLDALPRKELVPYSR